MLVIIVSRSLDNINKKYNTIVSCKKKKKTKKTKQKQKKKQKQKQKQNIKREKFYKLIKVIINLLELINQWCILLL